MGKAGEVADAIRRGGELARNQMVSVSLKDATIPHEVFSEFGGAKVLLRPASPGTGIIAGKTVRAVLESAGVKDILSKSLGSKNAANVVKATLKALLSLRTREDIYKGRGLEIKKGRSRRRLPKPLPPQPEIFMRLHDLKPRPGAKHRRKRLGQGESSGHGKTSGRGGKGQTARSGSSIRIGFEGGQMPLIRRIPKRGFNNARFATRYIAVNVGDLNRFDDGARVDETALRAAGLANGRASGVKILGDGELTKKLTVSAQRVQRLGHAPKSKPRAGRAKSSAANPPRPAKGLIGV